MADYITYFNGEWVPWSEVKIDPNDRGFMGGDVVFDAGRTFDGKSFRMKPHIDRLYRSLKYVRIDPGPSPEEMTDITEEVIRRNEPYREEVGDYSYWQFVTRGQGRRAKDAGPPTVCVKVAAIPFEVFAKDYDTGCHGVIVRTRSFPAQSLDPKVKHWSRMNFALADLETTDVDPDALPILTDLNGNLTEGISNNVFLVTDGVIRTAPDNDILQGVSRGMVLDLADQLNMPLVEEELQPYDLYTADEAFFSSTGPSVQPMTRVDNRQIGDGKPGRISNHLLAAWSEAVGVDIVGQAQRYAGR